MLASAICLISKAAAEVFIVDNDTPTALQVLLPLAAGKQVLGITTNLGDYDTDAATYEAAMALSTGNLTSCVPVYKGAEQPLLLDYNTYTRGKTCMATSSGRALGTKTTKVLSPLTLPTSTTRLLAPLSGLWIQSKTPRIM